MNFKWSDICNLNKENLKTEWSLYNSNFRKLLFIMNCKTTIDCTILIYFLDSLFQGAFEKIFSLWPLSKCFELKGNVYEWWFRWRLDRYVCIYLLTFCRFMLYSWKIIWKTFYLFSLSFRIRTRVDMLSQSSPISLHFYSRERVSLYISRNILWKCCL